jgi:hypothetical protein
MGEATFFVAGTANISPCLALAGMSLDQSGQPRRQMTAYCN